MNQSSRSPTPSKPAHPRARRRVPVYSDNPDSLERRVDYLKRTCEANLAELPESWRFAAESMHLQRVQDGRKPSSWSNWSWSLLIASQDLAGKDPATLSVLDCRKLVHKWLTEPNAACNGRPLKRSTVSTRCNHLAPYLATFHPHGPRQVALKIALLWCLKDAGGRVSELLSVNIGEVELARPKATLHLREDAPLLKTGARPIHLLEGASPLGVWLEMHPAQGDPKAPVFCNLRDRTGRRRMSDNTVDHMLKRWANAAGLQERDGHLLSSKDFRHTKATAIAKAGWDPALKKLHMGWSRRSNMESEYTHLDGADVLERLKRDYGIDDQGFRVMTEAADPVELLARVLDLMDQRRHGNPLRTQRPPELQQR